MLFRRESINEDVTPGAPAMFSFSSQLHAQRCSGQWATCQGPHPGSTYHGPGWCYWHCQGWLLALLCLLYLRRILRGPGEGGVLRMLMAHSSHGKPKWAFRAVCRIGAVTSVRLGKITQERSLFLYAPCISPLGQALHSHCSLNLHFLLQP